MAIIDDRTTNLNLPLPNVGNKLVDDVARLRTAISGMDSAVVLKADAAAIYTKAQVDAAIAGATPSFSTLTGKPTTAAGFGITDVMTLTATQAALDLKANQATTYTKVETDTRIQAVVGAAPAALDTLVEIAAQLASDESAAAALTTAVSLKAPLASPTFTGTVSGITKAMVGLGSVDNTTDAAKPISTATQTALDLKANSAALGTMSAQSATAVAITGGTITGVTFNGGTY